jgi:glycosyltransferase involved in cell wall biosynthesis
MRTLLVYDHLDTGGAQTHGLALAQELLKAGHTLSIASRGGAMEPRFTQLGVIVLRWPTPSRANPFKLARSFFCARQILHAVRPDVIHAHAVLPGVIFSLAARSRSGGRWPGRRPPIVITPHRSWDSLYRSTWRNMLSQAFYPLLRLTADEVIAISTGFYHELTRHGIPAERCHLIRNGIDVNKYDVPANTPTSPVVGTIGRLIEQKGLDVFIAAAALIAGHRSGVEFQIAGEGPLRATLEQQIAAQGLADRIHLLGNRSDVPDLLRQFSVFVSSSRWEGMPYALLEALAARRPVVATQVLGSEELIQDGVTGLLVPPADPTALSSAILKLLDDRTLAQRLAEAGRGLVEREYNQQAMAAQIMQLYQQANARRAT